MKSNMPYKDTDGIYKYYCAKAMDTISFLHTSENEDDKKVHEILVDELLKLENQISDCEKIIKMERQNNKFLHEVVQNLNKEIREMKEGMNG